MDNHFVTGKWYHYARLPEHEKKIYMHIYNGLKARKTDFTFRAEKHNGVYPTWARVQDLILHVLWDNPVLYYVDATNMRLNVDTITGQVRVEYTEYYSRELQFHVDRALGLRVEEILNLVREYKEGYPQLYRLLRYMRENIHYKYDAQKTDALNNLEARTIVGPLLNHLGVCSGYSKMFKLICDQIGIPCFYIHGELLGAAGWVHHGWNVVYLEGAFYHADLTIDCTESQMTNQRCCKYFMVGDATMKANHRWDRSQFPVMTEDYL